MTPREGGGGGGWPAALGSAAGVFLLLWPLPWPPADRLAAAAGDALHALLFAGLAWLWGRRRPGAGRGWRLWVALTLAAAGLEGGQALTGREPEWVDFWLAAAGAGVVCAPGRFSRALRWGALACLCAGPWLWTWAMIRLEWRAFPTLADPQAIWSRGGWLPNGVRLAGAGEGGLRVEGLAGDGMAPAHAYPGLFRVPVRSDWRGVRALRADVRWPDAVPGVAAIRVDDRPGNPPYAERFQREFVLTQGWNSVRIPADELGWAAGGRKLDLSRVRRWGVFLVSGGGFDYFSLGDVRLERTEERP